MTPILDRAHITDAIKFWERGRVLYNVALIVVSLGILLSVNLDRPGWYHAGLMLFVFAVIANVLYCAAYPIDLLVQASDFRKTWRGVRWALLLVGTMFAVVLAYITLGGPYVLGFPGEGPHG